MTDTEFPDHVPRLRGLLYLACPDADPDAISDIAMAIAEHTDIAASPQRAVPEAARLRQVPRGWPTLFLADADLSGADLLDADLTRANLRRTDLTDADLTGANLTDADLTDADLTRVDLTRANLSCADLTEADLSDADLTGANLTGANLTDVNLTGANLDGANLDGAKLTHADLTGANLVGARLGGARYMTLPINARWDLDTTWPEELASEVAAQSDQVSLGVYRVRGGQADDRSGSILA